MRSISCVAKAHQLLCRRFAACLVTIRNTRLCTMDSKVGKQPAAPYIMLEMLRQLSNESSYLYQEIFSALTAYLDGPRNKDHFSQQMFTLASCLGLVCCALKIFGGDSTDHADSVRNLLFRGCKTDGSSIWNL